MQVINEFHRAFLKMPSSPEFIGWNGERLIAKVLRKLKRKGFTGVIFRKVYVPIENPDETTEIDALYVTSKGVFVIESKNCTGWIFCSESDRNWEQDFSFHVRRQFYNPIKQNVSHIQKLWSYMTVNLPAFPIVVFSERCELKEINLTSPNVRVIKRDQLYATIKDIWLHAPDVLMQMQIDAVASKLEPLTNVDEKTKKAHIDRIKAKYR